MTNDLLSSINRRNKRRNLEIEKEEAYKVRDLRDVSRKIKCKVWSFGWSDLNKPTIKLHL